MSRAPAVVGVTAFFIHEIRLWGPWSPIHLIAIFTLIMLPVGVLRAHRHAQIERIASFTFAGVNGTDRSRTPIAS